MAEGSSKAKATSDSFRRGVRDFVNPSEAFFGVDTRTEDAAGAVMEFDAFPDAGAV